MAQPFDLQRLALTGDAVPIAENVPNMGFFRFIDERSRILHRPTSSRRLGVRGIIVGQLAWFDRAGKVIGIFGDPGQYRTLSLSPDGKRVAFERSDPHTRGASNIWRMNSSGARVKLGCATRLPEAR